MIFNYCLFFKLGEKNPDVVANMKELDKMKRAMSEKYQMLNNQRMDLTTAYERIFATYSKVQHIVLESELIQWKREQQLAGNGFNNNVAHLEVIQEWCEGLAEIVWNLKQQVKQVKVAPSFSRLFRHFLQRFRIFTID